MKYAFEVAITGHNHSNGKPHTLRVHGGAEDIEEESTLHDALQELAEHLEERTMGLMDHPRQIAELRDRSGSGTSTQDKPSKLP